MTTRLFRIFGLVLAGASVLAAQQGSLSGPVAGFIYDSPGRALRPIQGVPGASLIGDPLNLGLDLTAAYVSPRQDSAFVVSADGVLHFFRLTSAGPVETSLSGISVIPQRVVFSPSGTAAALLTPGKVQVFQALPGAPALAGAIKLPAAGGAQLSSVPASRSRQRIPVAADFAISDDGAYLLSVSAGSVRLLSVNGENRSLVPAGAGALVAFAPGGHDAAVIDPAAGLLLIRDAAGAATPQTIAQPDDSLASAAGIGFSQDGGRLYVASAAAQVVVIFDLAGSTRGMIACDCTPTTLVPMGSLFRLSEFSSAPLWLLDAGAAPPRIVFVPAPTN
jgi:DNA-binding beta-propeller fold protein YncE